MQEPLHECTFGNIRYSSLFRRSWRAVSWFHVPATASIVLALSQISCRERSPESGLKPTDCGVEIGNQAQLLEVFTDTSATTDVLLESGGAWVASTGGVRYFDRNSGAWTKTCTRYDGLALNAVVQLVRDGDDLFAFHPVGERYSVLTKGEKRWKQVPSEDEFTEKDEWSRMSNGMMTSCGSYVLRANDIWCVYRANAFGGRQQPLACEIRQYSRADFKLLRQIDLLGKNPSAIDAKSEAFIPVSLMADENEVWVATNRCVLRIEEDGSMRKFPLPDETVLNRPDLDNVFHNQIQSACLDDEAIWARLQEGIARFDRKTCEWKLLIRNEARNGGRRILSDGKHLWFCNGFDVVRYDKSTGEVMALHADQRMLPEVLSVDDKVLWTVGGRYSFSTGRWGNPQSTHSFHPMNAVLVGDYLLVRNSGEGLFIHNLASGKSRHEEIHPLEMMVHQGDVWLISQNDVHHFSSSKGELKRHMDTPFGALACRHLKFLKKDGTKYWYFMNAEEEGAKHFYSEHFLSFDADEGKLEIVVSLPEERRRDNANPSLVTAEHLYINSGEGTFRYDLQKHEWEKAPAHMQVNNGYWSAIAYEPKSTWHLYNGELRQFDGERYTKFYKLGPYMKLERATPEWLEISSRTHVLRFDGEQWKAAPFERPDFISPKKLIRAMDQSGCPTDRYVLIRYDELTVWCGNPVPETPLLFKPVEFSGDGVLRLDDP